MECFRFGEQEGSNGRLTTYNGSVVVEPDYPDHRFCAVVTFGPRDGERARMIIDKATAGKLGAALLKWAMPNNNAIRVHLAAVLAAFEAVTEANK